MDTPIGELIMRTHRNGTVETVEIVQADERIMVAPELLIQADPVHMAISWPEFTVADQVTYRIVSFDLAVRAFVAEKLPDAPVESFYDRFMREYFDPGLVGPA